MSPEKYNRVKEIFLAACDKPAAERAAFVDKESAGDAEIRQEVESLLKEKDRDKQVMPSDPENPFGSSMSAILSHADINLGPAASVESADGEIPEGKELSDDDSTSSSQSGIVDAGRFMAGTMAAGRYRIIELLGRGGMGEVYRADDTVLNQSVALKFLPALFGSDEKWLARLRDEVRLARLITHPNVCRVFDIGEFQGEQFISMEYIDGENLASLLRRIGRLPQDKALQIARQLCAGLAAAHDRGVLHRDLKPANVMIDGRGSVRITDFGLAAPVDQMRKEAIAAGGSGGAGAAAVVRAGTPAYMSPEQLTGKPVTVKSDIYSLGLVLYEMFTGRRAFKGGNFRDYQRLHSSEDPTPPSGILEDIDPIIDRVILRCLEKDPKDRPANALSVSASLPGGNPLREILAAGETPSPEVVAAAGEAHGGLKPRNAVGYLVTALACLFLVVCLAPSAFLIQKALRSQVPASSETAIKTLQRLGYTETPKDRASGFSLNKSYCDYVQNSLKTPTRWKMLLPPVTPDDQKQLEPEPQIRLVYFWYRQSPDYLAPLQADLGVKENDPPDLRPGMVRVRLDTQGTLIGLEAQPSPPPPHTAVPPTTASLSREHAWWEKLFDEANLTVADLMPVPPQGAIPVYASSRLAWDGTLGNGVGASASATIADGSVKGFENIVGGQRYDGPTAKVSLEGGGGQGAAAVVKVHHGEVQEITLTNGGTGYISPPTVTISSGQSVHIEAAEYMGRPVYFSIAGPGGEERYSEINPVRQPSSGVNTYFQTALSLGLLIIGSILAWRNYRSGRGDRSGALRMASAFFVLGFVAWVLRSHHVPDVLLEYSQFQRAVGSILYPAMVVWIFYLALEPYVRRVWPETVISWSRMISGKWFDLLVGRDILIGATAGTLVVVLEAMQMLVPRWIGQPAPMPSLFTSGRILASLGTVSTLFSGALSALYVSLIFLLLLVVLRKLVKNKIAASVIFIVMIVGATARIANPSSEPGATAFARILAYFQQLDYISVFVQALVGGIFLVILVRHGLVALIFCLFLRNLLLEFPITSDLNAWYAGPAIVAVVCALAILAISFHAALGGRSPIALRLPSR